jgi:hypothetical protein
MGKVSHLLQSIAPSGQLADFRVLQVLSQHVVIVPCEERSVRVELRILRDDDNAYWCEHSHSIVTKLVSAPAWSGGPYPTTEEAFEAGLRYITEPLLEAFQKSLRPLPSWFVPLH